jgi:hypothetical protein
VERVDVVEQFNRLLEAANAKAKEIKEASVTQKQLALPGCDTMADSGPEMGPEAGKESAKNGQPME